MKIYLKVIFLVLYCVSMIGYILPALYSARSYEAVALGIVLSIISPVIVYYTGESIVK